MQKKINKSLVGIILASGSGKRMKSSKPKQYLLINNISLLEINIEKFISLPYLSNLIVVISKKHFKFYKDIKNKYKNVFFIEGGNYRQKSAFNALKFLNKFSCNYVMMNLVCMESDGLAVLPINRLLHNLDPAVIQKAQNELISRFELQVFGDLGIFSRFWYLKRSVLLVFSSFSVQKCLFWHIF